MRQSGVLSGMIACGYDVPGAHCPVASPGRFTLLPSTVPHRFLLSPRSTINGHKKQVNGVLWNNNGNWLASGSMDGLIKLYDIRTMRELETWRGHNSEVSGALHAHASLS